MDKERKFPEKDSNLEEMKHFVRYVAENEEPLTTKHQIIGVQNTLDGIPDSAKAGEAVKVS